MRRRREAAATDSPELSDSARPPRRRAAPGRVGAEQVAASVPAAPHVAPTLGPSRV